MSTPPFTHPSSYRDPAGVVFEKEGVLYRQVNTIFKNDFDFFISSGCYQRLIENKLLVPHTILPENLTGSPEYYLTLVPEKVDFISYSYEWSFDMLKDAALLTLQLLKEAVSFGMILKDASPYNVQWHKGRLIFIDTLSFEKYSGHEPWIAYRQFCECFLAPLLLMHYHKTPLQEVQLAWPEGIPLSVVSKLLPAKSKLSLYGYLHIHLHAKIAAKNKMGSKGIPVFSRQKLLNLVNSLETLIRGLKGANHQSAWSAYYDEASQRNDYLDQKKKITGDWIDQLKNIETAVDLGANEGEFAQMLAQKNIRTIAVDFDPYCINNLYGKIKSSAIKLLQPLIIDLANPSPAIGLNNAERASFFQRCNTDLVLALALIHHLVIGKNIPFEATAELFSQAGKNLLIEFTPKQDKKIREMLQTKKDIYAHYNESGFIAAYEKYFLIIDRKIIPGTERVLFLLKRKTR